MAVKSVHHANEKLRITKHHWICVCTILPYIYIYICQTRSDDLNFEHYVHVYLSFRCIFLICSCHLSNHPSICELFYIQVLMMVIKTETLTSTSHHDIFTYLDYIFSCYLHTVGFYPYLLIYIYIYIYKSYRYYNVILSQHAKEQHIDLDHKYYSTF